MLKSLSDATGKLIGSVKSGIEIAVEAGKNSLMSHGGASDIILVRGEDGVLRSTEWHVHFDGDIQASEHKTQVRLWVGGRDSELTLGLGKDNRCFFKHEGGTDHGEQGGQSSLLPSEQQLQQMQQLNLVPGRNSASFQVREFDASTQSWEAKREMSCSIFLWGSHDSIVVVDHEGAVVKDDPWSKGAETISKARVVVSADLNPTSRVREDRGETDVHRAPIEEVSLVRDGAGALLSSISQAGFKLLFVTKAPISKVERVREGLQQISSIEVKKWGQAASLPDAPIICAPDHTMAVITNRLSSKALSVAGKSGRSNVFPASMLQKITSMYPRSGDGNVGGGLAGGVCFGSQGVETYLHGGVPSSRLLVVDKAGCVGLHQGDNASKWSSYGEVPVADIFPKICLF